MFSLLFAVGVFIAPQVHAAFDAATPRTYRPEWRSAAVNGPLVTLQQLETTDGRKVIEFRDPDGNIVGWTDTAGNVFIDGAYSLTQHTTAELNALGTIIGASKRAIAYNSETDTWQSWDGATWSNLSASSGAAIVNGDANSVVFMNGAGSALDTDTNMTFGVSPYSNNDTALFVKKIGSTIKSITRTINGRLDLTNNNGDTGAAGTAAWFEAHANSSGALNHIVADEAYTYQEGTAPLGSAYLYNGYAFQTGTGLVTDWYGLNLNFGNLTGANFTNATGILIGDIPGGSGTNYSIHTGTAPSWFNARVDATRIAVNAKGLDDSASKLLVQGPDSSGIGQVNIRSDDAYTTQKGGKTTWGGKYTSGGAFATFGQWGAEKEDGTDGSFVGDLVGKIQTGGAGVNEVVRYKGSNYGAYHIGNVYAPRLIGGATASDGSSYVLAQGAPAIGVGLMNSRDTTSFATGVGGSLSFQGPYTAVPNYATYAYLKGGKTNGTSGDFKGYYSISTNNGSSVTEGMRLTDTQFLGVGTTTPLQRLQVAGSTVLNNDAASSSLNNAYFVYNTGSAGAWGTQSYATTLGRNATTTRQRYQIITPDGADLSYATHTGGSAPTAQSDFTERFVIRGDSGNVGVGTAAPVSSLDVNGSLGLKSVTVSDLSSNAGENGVILADSTSTNVNVALPQASTHAGRVYQITKIVAANQVVIDPSGVELINGASNYILYGQYESVTIACNGTAWYITAKSAPAQGGSATNPGLISSTDWTTFNGKVGGSGTTGKLPKFTGATTLADSILTESSSKVGVAQATPASTLEVGGSFGANVSTSSVPFTAASAHVYLATGTGTISLPSASTVTNREYVIRNAGSGTVTVDPNSTDPMDGTSSGTLVLQVGEGATIACDGTGWWTVDRRYAPASSGSPAVANGLFTIPSVNKIVGVNSSGLATGVALSGLTFDGTTLTATGSGGSYLPLSGGTMTGDILGTGSPNIGAGGNPFGTVFASSISSSSYGATGGTLIVNGTTGLAVDTTTSTNKNFTLANGTHLSGNADVRNVATMTSGASSKAVSFPSYAYASAPTAVLITPKSDPGSQFWVDTITTTGFTIHTTSAVGADTDFMWFVIQ